MRTPAAYLYCGTVRTAGVAAVAAAAGRGPIVCVDVLAEKTTILLMNISTFNLAYTIQKLKQPKPNTLIQVLHYRFISVVLSHH